MGKILIITEKSSAGNDIAPVIGLKASDLKDGYYENDKYILSWARGHLVGQKEPKELYGEKESWDIEKLPFQINQETNLKIITEKGAGSIFKTLKELINRSDVDYIINAGDSGREGELIQRWIYKMAGNKKPVKRYWNSDNSKKGIKKSFENLEPSSKYDNMYEEGKALKLIDWMYGMTYTVALTKIYETKDSGALHYGRCQTPLLNLIVERDNEIKNFKVEKYNLLKADFSSYKGTKLILDKETNKYINDMLKFQNEDEKNTYLNNWKQYKEGTIFEYNSEDKEQKAPRCFSMSKLQQYLGKKYGFTPDYTLELAQSLYEKGYTSYPRTNSEYLTEDMWGEKKEHIDACIDVIKNLPELSGINLSINENKEMSKDYVDNSKIEDHYAIIPTCEKADLNTLNDDEKNAYIEICKRFIAIFMDTYKYKATTIITEINKEYFKTTGSKEMSKGYKVLYGKEIEDDKNKEDDDENNNLPTLKKGDKVVVNDYELKEGETKPKSRYNVGNITDVMDKYGIGTQATQAAIIKNLINQKVIDITSKGKKKEYIPTEKGIELIKLIPDDLKSCDLTKRIENKIKEVGKGKLLLKNLQDEIYKEQVERIKILKEAVKDKPLSFSFSKEKEILGKCPFCGKDMVESKIGCSHKEWKDNPCNFTIFSNSLYTNITISMMKDLLSKGITVGTFKSKEGKKYKQEILIDKENMKLKKGEFVNDKK